VNIHDLRVVTHLHQQTRPKLGILCLGLICHQLGGPHLKQKAMRATGPVNASQNDFTTSGQVAMPEVKLG